MKFPGSRHTSERAPLRIARKSPINKLRPPSSTYRNANFYAEKKKTTILPSVAIFLSMLQPFANYSHARGMRGREKAHAMNTHVYTYSASRRYNINYSAVHTLLRTQRRRYYNGRDGAARLLRAHENVR